MKMMTLVILFLFSLIGCVVYNKVDLGTLFKSPPQFQSIGGVKGAKSKVVVIPITGTIIYHSRSGRLISSDEVTPFKIKNALNNLDQFEEVAGLILEVNSPGGSAAASEEILSILTDYKLKKNIPIVVYVAELAASGAYYISQIGDQIVANPNSIIGSIGVISYFPQLNRFLNNKLDIQVVTIKSGEMKDFGSMFRQMTDAEKKYWKSQLLLHYHSFVDVVVKGRSLNKQKVIKLADGRVFHPTVALQNQLIDKIGTLDIAFKELERLNGQVKDSEWIQMSSSSGINPLSMQVQLNGVDQTIGLGQTLSNQLPVFDSNRIWYMYW